MMAEWAAAIITVLGAGAIGFVIGVHVCDSMHRNSFIVRGYTQFKPHDGRKLRVIGRVEVLKERVDGNGVPEWVKVDKL